MQLLPLTDAKNRWNSALLMLKRASRLQRYINQYCGKNGDLKFRISNIEWRKIEYVVQVTMPFVHFTMALLASKDATIHRACFLFETLIVQIDKSIEVLGAKSALWKQKLCRALVGMKMELQEIHEKTFEDLGVMYGTGTLIAPQYKVSAFDDVRSSCLGHAERYIEYLKIFHLQYRPQMPTSLSCLNGMSCSPQLLELERVLHPLTGLVANSMSQNDEVGQYLREGMSKCLANLLLTTDIL